MYARCDRVLVDHIFVFSSTNLFQRLFSVRVRKTICANEVNMPRRRPYDIQNRAPALASTNKHTGVPARSCNFQKKLWFIPK
mmetsp:Transcript_18478/g.35339  ORF Transcript_18478/g.35339 Transcript_18478/m.35339 type:complete len:82 (+) Transcript_18478:437-682(+)